MEYFSDKEKHPSPVEVCKTNIKSPKSTWENVLWPDETKVELFGHDSNRYIWHKNNTPHHPKEHHIHSEAWWWQHYVFLQLEPGPLRVEGIMKSSKYQAILAQIFQVSVRKLKFTFQHDNDPKHTSKSTKAWLHQKKINILESPSQSPDLNPIEHLWGYLKRAVHRRCPRNLTDLERFCKEEWANIATSRCAMLIDSYPKRLSAVIKSKGASTKFKGLHTYATRLLSYIFSFSPSKISVCFSIELFKL
uniref:Tc1-like transposase DDE domain-containing protein n=1 Tax=Esox lucius TaxID=8010 RepID=A0AAY5KN16_ESOLU